MTLVRLAILLAATLLSTGVDATAPKVGDEFEITKSYETSQKGDDGSSGSSHGRDTLVERVIAIREAGIELEYDLPQTATPQDRARQWQFPARVLRPSEGPLQLLNAGELETRVEAWLKSAKWSREVCGRWIFTWNAFQIECDPASVIETIGTFDLSRIDARDGAPYRDGDGLGQAMLTQQAESSGNPSLAAEMQVDPDAVRRASAKSDVVVGQIMSKPVTFEAALLERGKETIAGTISITLETDPAGGVLRRTRKVQLRTASPDGVVRNDTMKYVVERRRVSGPDPWEDTADVPVR